MGLELIRHAALGEFYRRVAPFLAEHETENDLLIRICTTRLAHPERTEPNSYLAEVALNGAVLAVAVRTPPRNVVLAVIPERSRVLLAIAPLVDDLRAYYGDTLPGVIGPARESRAFAHRWQRETGQTFQEREPVGNLRTWTFDNQPREMS